MKKLLFLCENFYPDSIIGAKRISMFVYFLSKKYDITVVRSGALVGVPSLRLGLEKNPHVKIISYCGPNSDCDKVEKNQRIPPSKAKTYKDPSKFRLFISKLIKPFKYYNHEVKIIRKTKNICKNLLSRTTFDLVVTTFSPLGSNSVGYYLKKKYGIKWIMDIRDLMDIPSRGPFVRLINSRLQKKYANSCDALTTPTFGFKDELIKRTHTCKPVFVLYNGYFKLTDSKCTKSPELTFCYTGTIHNDLCTLKPFADCLLSLIEEKKIDPKLIQIIYAGSNQKLFFKQMGSVSRYVKLIDEGYCNLEKISEIQGRSDVFLLMVMNQKNYTGVLTGKMSEGIQFGAPLLGFVFGNKGNSELFQTINKYSLGYCYEDINQTVSFDEMKDYLIWLYDKKISSKNSDISFDIPKSVSQLFNYEYICERLDEIICDIINKRQ